MYPNTFYDRVVQEYNTSFTESQSEKRAKGDSLLKVRQFESAVKDKNTAMLIWLGKTRLEQREPEAKANAQVVQAFERTLEIVRPKKVEVDAKNEAADFPA